MLTNICTLQYVFCLYPVDAVSVFTVFCFLISGWSCPKKHQFTWQCSAQLKLHVLHNALPLEKSVQTANINCIAFSSSSFPVLSSVQVYMAWCPPPPPTAPVYFVDDGLLHWPVTRLRSQAPPNWCPGWLCAGSSGGLLYSKCSHHTTYINLSLLDLPFCVICMWRRRPLCKLLCLFKLIIGDLTDTLSFK